MPLSDLSDPDVLLRKNWEARVTQGADGTPTLRPHFVAELGPRVWLVDVRDDEELVGSLGHIPGVWRAPMARVGEVAEKLPHDTPVVLVCSDGRRSGTAARYLGALGMTTVAALTGGMALWRSKGFGASRDRTVLDRFLRAPEPGHGSDGRPLDAGRGAAHLTKEAIEGHVGDPGKVRSVKLAALLLVEHTSCVDGREDRAILGTPGGDAGELVLGLACVEKAGGKVDTGKMPSLTRAFADTFGGIYLHTDNTALNRLARALQEDRRLEGAVAHLHTVHDWTTFLRRPPEALRTALLDHLLQPEHVGCGHLALAMRNADQYQVRTELITSFFEAFYTELWEGAPDLEWVVLGGGHAEGAVANVTVEGELWPFTEVPMLAPSVEGVQMFVNHPQVVAYMREQTARFFTSRVDHLLPLGKDDASAMGELLPELGATQAGATLSALAKGLPLFGIHFAPDGTVSVEASGTV